MTSTRTLREYIKEAEEKSVAIGHFNFSNLEGFHAIYVAAKKLNLPVIVALSEGEEKFVGLEEGATLVKTIRARDNYPIFLNADHHHSFESVKKCIDIGFDMVIIDGTSLSFEENVKLTKQCVDYVLTTPEDAKKFVELTGIDMFAPSVGSIHGLIKTGKPHIDAELVKQIKETVKIPLVLHGGSGLRDIDFVNAIKAGISIVHINSEIRLAYEEAVGKFIASNPEEINPSKILQPAVDAMEKIVEARLKLFNGIE